MPNTIWTPTTGRLRRLASALFLSVLGLPVAGSFGSLSATIVPQSSVPQLAIRTVAAPLSVSQLPLGSAASAGANEVASKAAASVPTRRIVVMGSPRDVPVEQ